MQIKHRFKCFRVAIVKPAYQTDTAPPFPIMQSVVHAVSDGFFSE